MHFWQTRCSHLARNRLARDIQAQLLVMTWVKGEGKLSHLAVHVGVQGQQQLLHPPQLGREPGRQEPMWRWVGSNRMDGSSPFAVFFQAH